MVNPLVAAPSHRGPARWIAVKGPVASEILDHRPCQRHHPVLAAFPAVHPQLALVALDVMHREAKALGKAQSRAVDKLQGNTIAPKTNAGQQLPDFLAGQHCGQFAMIPRADLRKDLPFLLLKHLDEEQSRCGRRLPDGLRLPVLTRLHMQDVGTQLVLAEQGGIAPEVFVDEAETAVVGMPGAGHVVSQGQQLGEALHRRPRMRLVVERIPIPRPDLGLVCAPADGSGGG
jgi:hypothetical protein